MSRTFPAALRLARESAGLSLNALAKRAGVDPTQLGRYERGEREPTLSSLAALADALGCSLDDLAGRTSPRGGEVP